MPGAERGGYLRSALAMDGGWTTFERATDWFREHAEALRADVRQVRLEDLAEWDRASDPVRLVHRTGRFFAVEGYRLAVSGVPWVSGPSRADVEQPLINQPEIGILGFLTKTLKGTRHFLVQAKMEPGNVGQVQLAPTVQATRSNYTRVHGGSSTPFLEYFIKGGRSRVLVDELQPEQGAYFLEKRNRNMVVETDEDIRLEDCFCWMTLAHLKAFLRVPYAVNMDARSVLSCLPLADDTEMASAFRPGRPPVEVEGRVVEGFGRALLWSSDPSAGAEHTSPELERWWEELRARANVIRVPRPIDRLTGWHLDGGTLRPVCSRRPFSVIGVAIGGGRREVPAWSQPLLARSGIGLLGLLTQVRSGTLHVLVQASAEPGCSPPLQLMPTVVCNHDYPGPQGCHEHPFSEWFLSVEGPDIRFAAFHSEEGGRFWGFEYRYVVAEAPPDADLDLSGTYRWMTLEQVGRFRARGNVSVEARNVLACLGAALAG